jgi:hypothetical protein
MNVTNKNGSKCIEMSVDNAGPLTVRVDGEVVHTGAVEAGATLEITQG